MLFTIVWWWQGSWRIWETYRRLLMRLLLFFSSFFYVSTYRLFLCVCKQVERENILHVYDITYTHVRSMMIIIMSIKKLTMKQKRQLLILYKHEYLLVIINIKSITSHDVIACTSLSHRSLISKRQCQLDLLLVIDKFWYDIKYEWFQSKN